MDVIDLCRRALTATGDVVAGVTPAQLDGPTPCSQWSLRDLLCHVVDSNLHVAASARGDTPGPAGSYDSRVEEDPVGAYQDSAGILTAALADPDVLTRRIDLPGFGPLPAVRTIGAHFLDTLVHCWDIAKAVGVSDDLDAELTAAALVLAGEVPDVPAVRGPAGVFSAVVKVPDDAPAHERLVGLLGRSPSWPH